VRKAERRNILTIRYFAFFFSVNKKAKLWKTGGGVDGFFRLCRTPTIAFCHVSEFFFSFFSSFPSYSSLSL
jgi:hypothetical protein